MNVYNYTRIPTSTIYQVLNTLERFHEQQMRDDDDALVLYTADTSDYKTVKRRYSLPDLTRSFGISVRTHQVFVTFARQTPPLHEIVTALFKARVCSTDDLRSRVAVIRLIARCASKTTRNSAHSI